jgi:hypothetical protein
MDRTEEVGNEATRTAVAMIRALANGDEQAFLDLWHGSEHQYFVLLALATVPLSMVRAGPKRAVTAPPLDLSGLGRVRRTRAVRFIEDYLLVPKGTGAREPVRLRPWQVDLVRTVLADGVRQGLVSLPRGNGKTTLAAMLAVWGLFDGPEGAQVLTVASDERQAGSSGTQRRMIELDPRAGRPGAGLPGPDLRPAPRRHLAPSRPTRRPARLGPDALIVDELHVVREPVYEAMSRSRRASASGRCCWRSRPRPTTPESVMWRLVEHGRRRRRPLVRLRRVRRPRRLRGRRRGRLGHANPALGDFLHVDALRSTMKTTREAAFRRFRLGQWVGQVDSWLPWGAWDELRRPPPHRRARRTDRARLRRVGVGRLHRADRLHARRVRLRRRRLGRTPAIPAGASPVEVDATVAATFDQYEVVELAATRGVGAQRSRRGPSATARRRVWSGTRTPSQRMAPATDRMYAGRHGPADLPRRRSPAGRPRRALRREEPRRWATSSARTRRTAPARSTPPSRRSSLTTVPPGTPTAGPPAERWSASDEHHDHRDPGPQARRERPATLTGSTPTTEANSPARVPAPTAKEALGIGSRPGRQLPAPGRRSRWPSG